MSERLIETRELCKSFPSGERTIQVLNGAELAVESGGTLAIVGDSGVGKSTLLHLLGGLDRPDSGQILFRGRDLFGGSARERAEYRNHQVGFVFQLHHLLPEFTAFENVQMPFRVGREADAGGERPRELLERLGLGERLQHYPGMLSGGEQQRVAIARSLARRPALLLADEPTGNLDPATGRDVFTVLRELQQELGFALILATHSERLARACERLLRLDGGRLHELDEHQTAAYFEGLGAGGGSDPML